MDNSEITIKFIEPTEEQKCEYKGFHKLINSWFHLVSLGKGDFIETVQIVEDNYDT
jgi:hypothetical protein